MLWDSRKGTGERAGAEQANAFMTIASLFFLRMETHRKTRALRVPGT